MERAVRAKLLNIGSGGALIELHLFVAPRRAVKVGIENAPEFGWLDAKVIRIERSIEVVIGFSSPCDPPIPERGNTWGQPTAIR